VSARAGDGWDAEMVQDAARHALVTDKRKHAHGRGRARISTMRVTALKENAEKRSAWASAEATSSAL